MPRVVLLAVAVCCVVFFFVLMGSWFVVLFVMCWMLCAACCLMVGSCGEMLDVCWMLLIVWRVLFGAVYWVLLSMCMRYSLLLFVVCCVLFVV